MSAPKPVLHEEYGLIAEFAHPEDILRAAVTAHSAGFRRISAYSPFPVEGLAEAIGFHHSRLPFLVLIGGIVGGLAGYGLQYYISVIDYPLNIGGRPYHSWPAFIPITFECTILGAALTAVLGMLGLNLLPQPYHPVFNVPEFGMASRDRFFLVIESRDLQYDLEKTKAFLEALTPVKVSVVPR